MTTDELEATLPPVADWDAVLEWLDSRWQPGEHCSIFGRTGSGKTYTIVNGLLPLWTRSEALIIDVKHDKGTMDPIGHVVTKKPNTLDRIPFKVRDWTRGKEHESWDKDPAWFKLQPKGHHWSPDRNRQRQRSDRVRAEVGEALDDAFHRGNCVIVVDDAVTVAARNPPNLDLGDLLGRIWRDGRDRGITVIAATQAPANAPSAMYDQPTFLIFSRMRDARRQLRLGEIAGDADLIETTLPQLEHQQILLLDGEYGDAVITKVA